MPRNNRDASTSTSTWRLDIPCWLMDIQKSGDDQGGILTRFQEGNLRNINDRNI
jgi:hypothetical protein